MFFRNPCEMANKFFDKWKKVTKFQNDQQKHFYKRSNEQLSRAAKQMKIMQKKLAEYTKREQSIAEERDKYKSQSEQQSHAIQKLQQKLAQRTSEADKNPHVNLALRDSSTLIAGGGKSFVNTPILLGLAQQCQSTRSSTTPRGMSFFNI